jgi:hypothetical protein
MCLRATAAIPAGSPITITYIDNSLPRSNRQEVLREMYDFTCTCQSCTLPLSASIESDRKRVELARVMLCVDASDESDLKAWIKDPLLPDSHIIDQWKPIWDMLVSEGMWRDCIWSAVIQYLCKAYCALGDKEKAAEWALTGVLFSQIWKGSNNGWADVARAPEKTAWWGLRKALTKSE